MNKDLAKHIARVAFEASAELGNLVPLINGHCSQEEYQKLGWAIASASAAISTNILEQIFRDHPELRQHFDDDIKTYGRII